MHLLDTFGKRKIIVQNEHPSSYGACVCVCGGGLFLFQMGSTQTFVCFLLKERLIW